MKESFKIQPAATTINPKYFRSSGICIQTQHTTAVLILPLGAGIKTRVEVSFLLMPFYRKGFSFPPPFSYFARHRHVGKLDSEQEQKCAQGVGKTDNRPGEA